MMKIDLRHIHFPRINVQLDWRVIGGRVALIAAGTLAKATLAHQLPTTTGGLLTLTAGAVAAAGPSILQSAGLVFPAAPGAASLWGAAAQAVGTLINTPKAQRAQQMEQIASQTTLKVIADWQNKTGQFAPGELAPGPLAAPPLTGAGEPNDPATAGGAATAPVAANTGIPAVTPDPGMTSDPAIAATGGNQ